MEIAPTHRLIEARQFRPQRAWDALDIAEMQGITVRLHWTDTAYRWHVNDGEEVFAVLDGQVDMHLRREGELQVLHLHGGDVFHALPGCEHMAHPQGEARILVVEKKGSV